MAPMTLILCNEFSRKMDADMERPPDFDFLPQSTENKNQLDKKKKKCRRTCVSCVQCFLHLGGKISWRTGTIYLGLKSVAFFLVSQTAFWDRFVFELWRFLSLDMLRPFEEFRIFQVKTWVIYSCKCVLLTSGCESMIIVSSICQLYDR